MSAQADVPDTLAILLVNGTLTGFLSELATSSGSGRNRLQRLSKVLALFVGAAAAPPDEM